MTNVKAFAAREQREQLKAFSFDLEPPKAEEVQIEIMHCGICHTDLVFLDNEWGNIPFPLVPGHEIVGRITKLGDVARDKGLQIGQIVGVGWMKESCLHCNPCFDGETHLCENGKATIMGNHGGFASHIKTHWHWTVPIPAGVSAADAGPLLCAGITVFAPLLHYGISPTSTVGVFGIGGLGHLALQFLKAWGARTVAFSSSAKKADEIRGFGADTILPSTDDTAWDAWKGKFDLILITSFNGLNWEKVTSLLAPNGRLHIVGLVGEPVSLGVASLIMGQKQVSGSPVGSRSALGKMLQFAERHKISPLTEHFPMSKVNEAIAHLRSGHAHYRLVLDADF